MPIQPRAFTGFSGLTVSFIDWIGGAVAAVLAGRVAPTIVTTTPTMRPMTTSLADGAGEPDSGMPLLLIPLAMSSSSPHPSSTPMPEPTKPRMMACTSTLANTCNGEAPTERSSA